MISIIVETTGEVIIAGSMCTFFANLGIKVPIVFPKTIQKKKVREAERQI